MFIVGFNLPEYRKALVAEAEVIWEREQGELPKPDPGEFNYCRGMLDGILKAIEMLDKHSIMPS